MACTVRRPMPGQEKMVSVTMVPARSVPNCSPRMVMMGMSALRKAWRKRTARVESPLGGAERNGGQDEVEQPIADRDGQPAELDRENQNQDRTKREIGNGEAEEREQSHGTVRSVAAAMRREYPRRNPNGDADEKRDNSELKSGRIAVENNLQNGRLVLEGPA